MLNSLFGIASDQSGKKSRRQCLRAPAASVLAMLAVLSAAKAQDTTVDSNFTNKNVYGNHTGSTYTNRNGDPRNNTLTFTTGAQYTNTSGTARIYGSYAESTAEFDATGNTVTINAINSKSKKFYLYGGFAQGHDAAENEVVVNGGSITVSTTQNEGELELIGGYSTGGEVTDNEVTIAGGTFKGSRTWVGNVMRDNAEGTAAGNKVTVTDGTFDSGVVLAGSSIYGGTASDNKIYVNGGTFKKGAGIYASMSHEAAGTVSGNEVFITDGNFSGGAAVTGSDTHYENSVVSGNKVTVTGGTFNVCDDDYYQFAGGVAYAGGSTVSSNEVLIEGGVFSDMVQFIGGAADYDSVASDNKVTVTDGTFDGEYTSIIGGEAGYIDSNHIAYGGTATDNEVLIAGGTFNNSEGISITGGEVINDTVSGNEVSVTDGTFAFGIGAQILGGYLILYPATTTMEEINNSNKITISDVTFAGEDGAMVVLIGSYDYLYNTMEGAQAEIAGNEIAADGATFEGNDMILFGSNIRSFLDVSAIAAAGNEVTMENNKVALTEETILNAGGKVDVFGAYAQNVFKAVMENNEVTLTEETAVNAEGDIRAYGGNAENVSRATLSGNKVTIDNINIAGGDATTVTLAGGEIKQIDAEAVGTAANNMVAATGTTIGGDKIYAYGSHVYSSDDVSAIVTTGNEAATSGNKVTFTESTTLNAGGNVDVSGAYAEKVFKATIENNEVTLTEGTAVNAEGDIRAFGGNAENVSRATLSGNKITIDDVNLTGSDATTVTLAGGDIKLIDAEAVGTAASNTVTATGATIGGDKIKLYGSRGDASGDASEIEMSGNEVKADTVTFNGKAEIAGAYGVLEDGDNSKITANANTVTVENGAFNGTAAIYGGYIITAEGAANADTAITGNKIVVKDDVFAQGARIIGGYNPGGKVEDNEIYVEGGIFDGETYNLIAGGVSDTAEAVKNNTVYVYGDADLSNVYLIAATDTDSYTVRSGGGNKLVFGYDDAPWDSADNKVGSIEGFDTVQITAATWNKPINVAYFDAADANTGKTAIDATKVAFSGVSKLIDGAKTVLMQTETIDGEMELISRESVYTVGTTVEGKGTVSLKDNNGDEVADTVIYTIGDGSEVQPQTHTTAMASTAKMTALNQTSDTAAAALSSLAAAGNLGIQNFAAAGGMTTRRETGSHVTLNAVSLAVGVGGNGYVGSAKLSLGGALETGYGKYENHFYAGDADPYINKKGHVFYYGGALLSEMKWKSGWHVNANLRAGYAKTEQSAALYSAGTNSVYDIDSGSYYIGGELGLGKIIDVGVRHSIDWYGKYIYLHQGSNSFYAGGEYDVKGINSYRLQLAGRYNYDLGKRWFLYAGLGGEYEFDGEGRVWADGLEVEPTKNKGMRGIGELGVKLSPEDSGFSIDVSVKGSIGKFRSALFGLEMKYEF